MHSSPYLLGPLCSIELYLYACFPSAHEHSAPPLPPQPPPIPPSDPPSSLSLDTRSWTLSHRLLFLAHQPVTRLLPLQSVLMARTHASDLTSGLAHLLPRAPCTQRQEIKAPPFPWTP